MKCRYKLLVSFMSFGLMCEAFSQTREFDWGSFDLSSKISGDGLFFLKKNGYESNKGVVWYTEFALSPLRARPLPNSTLKSRFIKVRPTANYTRRNRPIYDQFVRENKIIDLRQIWVPGLESTPQVEDYNACSLTESFLSLVINVGRLRPRKVAPSYPEICGFLVHYDEEFEDQINDHLEGNIQQVVSVEFTLPFEKFLTFENDVKPIFDSLVDKQILQHETFGFGTKYTGKLSEVVYNSVLHNLSNEEEWQIDPLNSREEDWDLFFNSFLKGRTSDFVLNLTDDNRFLSVTRKEFYPFIYNSNEIF